MPDRLAIHGGTPVLAPGTIRAWPPVDDLDARYVLASLKGGRHAYGPNCVAFEREFAIWNGNRFAVATNSGTAALHMAVAASGCLEGDEVIVPAYSWSSSATCALLHNGIPVFVDIDWATMNLDVAKIEAAITPKTKAILVVHLHGLAVDMDAVLDLAQRHGLKVIEDVCQAHGARFKDRMTGTLGHAAAFSFNQHKNLCTGEGGMFVTDDEAMMKTARRLWSFGEAATPAETRDYHVYSLGWMYRMNDLTAAFGRAQLTRLEMYLEWQERSVPLLTRRLGEVPHLILPTEPASHEHTWYNYVIRFDLDAMGHAEDARAFREKIVRALTAEGVPVSIWQRCILPAMTIFQTKNAYGHGTPWSSPHARPVDYDLAQYPVAQRHCDTHICLGEAIRYPNGSDVIEGIAAAFAKVMSNLDQLEAPSERCESTRSESEIGRPVHPFNSVARPCELVCGGRTPRREMRSRRSCTESEIAKRPSLDSEISGCGSRGLYCRRSLVTMSRRPALVGFLLGLLLANGPGGRASAAAMQTLQSFRSGVEIVEVTATVTDEQGRPVTGLSPGDFTILDDGRQQAITVFGRVDLPPPAPRSPAPSSASRRVAVRAADVSANDIAPDGRVFALILDDQLTQPFRTLSVRRLAREFVEQHVGPSDLVAVFSTGGRGALTQEFTTDHARVLAAIDRFQGNRIRRGPETDPERVFGIETAMDAIAALADHLKGIRGRRVAAVYISEGIDYNIYQAMRPSAIPGNLSPADVAALLGARGERSTGATEDRERQATPVIRAIQRAMEQLSRANVVLYGVDPRGLYSPDGEWLEFNPRDKTDVEPPTREEHARSIESLRVVSESTGGFALVNTNDFGDLFRRVVAESSHYYVLGYSPSRPGQSGQYRRITVRVRPGLRVAAREGYIVPARRPAAPPVRAVLAALDDSLPLPHLPLRVQAIPLPPVAAGATTRPVQVIVEIDGEGLTFREENGRFTERIELAVKTLDGLAREANRAATEMALPPLSSAQRDRIVGAGIRWLTTVALAPGAHSLRVAAQATTAGRTGSVFVDVDVPAIGDEGVRLTDLALTATSAADTPTGGTPAIVAPLPTPPTTRRTFRVGETITVGTTVESSLSSAPVTITAMVHRITEDAELLVTSAAPPVVRPEGDAAHVIFSLPTAGFAPSRYVIGLGQPAAGDALREVVVELRP